MDNRRTRKDGRYYQLSGHFMWWPTSVNRGKPWPKEVPVLRPSNFHSKRADGTWLRDSPDKRLMDQWYRGFPHDKVHRVYEAHQQAIKEVTGRGIGGSYKVWMWAYKQEPKTLADVWNLAMRNLGYVG